MKSIGTLLLIMGFYGSTSYVIKTYIFVTQKMNWKEAQQYCRLHYDDLSTISNLDENDSLLGAKATLCNDGSFISECRFGRWIGLFTDGTDSSVWKWSGEQDSKFRMWAEGEPGKSDMLSCAYYDLRTGEWYTASCSLNLTFICMEESTDPQLILVKQNKTWEEALDYCRSYYTDLASLRSDEENDWATMKSQRAETEHMWIGLHYVAKYWIWVNGYALEYKAWSEDGHPKCPGSSHRCGALETEEKTWKPRDCEEKLNFLCLKKLKD